MVDFRVSVVLPAAGSGSRMGCDMPKQYLKILDRPLISYTIKAFECISWIENIVVVVSATHEKFLEKIVVDFNHKKVITTCGESTRHKSIYNGVRCLIASERKPDIVLIHDAVRPFIEEDVLKEIVIAARKHGAVRLLHSKILLACGIVRPLISTVLARNASGFLDHSLDRSKFVASEMPQAFQYDVIHNAYQKALRQEYSSVESSPVLMKCLLEAGNRSRTSPLECGVVLVRGIEIYENYAGDVLAKCTQDDFEFGTECLHLALKYCNVRALLLDGPDYLWKITYKKDIYAAEGIIKEQQRRLAVFSGNFCDQELERIVREQFNTKSVEIQNYEKFGLCKVNILVNLTILQPHECPGSNSKINRNKIQDDLQRIDRNGILVIVHNGGKEELMEVRKTTEHIFRKGKEKGITCCGVWCEGFFSSTPQKKSCEKLAYFAKMIVNVALETSQSFSGQVFTVLDME